MYGYRRCIGASPGAEAGGAGARGPGSVYTVQCRDAEMLPTCNQLGHDKYIIIILLLKYSGSSIFNSSTSTIYISHNLY